MVATKSSVRKWTVDCPEMDSLLRPQHIFGEGVETEKAELKVGVGLAKSLVFIEVSGMYVVLHLVCQGRRGHQNVPKGQII